MTRLTIFLFFFTLSTMAQITVSGRVFDGKNKPFPKAIVSNGREKVYTDSQGNYTIQAKQWDTIYFGGMRNCYVVFKDTPHQVYNHTMDRLYRNSNIHIEYAYGCGILFIRNDKIVEEKDREAFKKELRSGQFYKYSVMEKQELFEQYGYLSQYGLVAYTKDYYNEHKKNKSKKK